MSDALVSYVDRNPTMLIRVNPGAQEMLELWFVSLNLRLEFQKERKGVRSTVKSEHLRSAPS